MARVLARPQQFTCFIVPIETQLTNLITFFFITPQTNNNIDNMAGIVYPYIIVDQCLEWIGFGIPNQRATISTEVGLTVLMTLMILKKRTSVTWLIAIKSGPSQTTLASV